MVEVIGLKKVYGDFTAVDHVSFDIRRGELFGFLGPNGAGKTSTINMLIGLAKITEGRVLYRGQDCTGSMKKAQKLIGVVGDESNLYEDLSGFENLCFCGSLYGLSKEKRESRARELLKSFKLEDAAQKPFKTYSKGMKRKLTIAAALIHEPEMLFLDEPTTGIDVASARQIRSLLHELNEGGTSMFLTTHYIEEAERLCDRVAFITKGRIVKLDTVKNLLADLQDESVCELSFDSNTVLKDLDISIKNTFPDTECSYKNKETLRISSKNKLDIAPLLSYLGSEGISVYEAKLIRPSLEDAFIRYSGIEIEMLKKEKEKK